MKTNLVKYLAGVGADFANIFAPKGRECDCGAMYNSLIRRIKVAVAYNRDERGTKHRFCSDRCCNEYTQSQDFLDPSFTKQELESLLSE